MKLELQKTYLRKVLNKLLKHVSKEELEGIELGEPCKLFKLNERNRKLCTKVDYFLLGYKLSWATAHFVRCNGIKCNQNKSYTTVLNVTKRHM